MQLLLSLVAFMLIILFFNGCGWAGGGAAAAIVVVFVAVVVITVGVVGGDGDVAGVVDVGMFVFVVT